MRPFAVALLVLCTFSLQAESAHRPPNIVYILADDMGVGDVSALNPHCAWKTPTLDRLAHHGRAFTDALMP